MPARHVGRRGGAMRPSIALATLAASLLVSAAAAAAQAPAAPGADASFRAYVTALRRADPAAAEKFQALRDARERSVAELHEAEARYAASGPELRTAFLGKLRSARHRYAEASLAILDFLDDRDTKTLTEYQAAIAELRALLEKRKQTRAELENLLDGE